MLWKLESGDQTRMSETVLAWEVTPRVASERSWWEQQQEVGRALEFYSFVFSSQCSH